jgi:flagellar biosynthesis/type III secretory pathway protein FliH
MLEIKELQEHDESSVRLIGYALEELYDYADKMQNTHLKNMIQTVTERVSDLVDFYKQKTLEAFHAGLQDGYIGGYDAGKDVGYDEGYDEGYDVGYDEGYNTGYDMGYSEGYDNGYFNATE